MSHHDQIQKSRLGRILVNRGYISESQLDQALVAQAEEGRLLGAVLLDRGWISDRDLKRVLRHQKNYRFATAAITMVVAPLQPMFAFAATPIGLPVISPRAEASVDQMPSLKGLQALDDEALSSVNAQGFFPAMASPGLSIGQNADGIAAGFYHKYDEDEEYEEQDDESIAGELADTVLTVAGLGPISNMIEADITIQGLEYHTDKPMMEVLDGGRMKFYMPKHIDRISMENIRVKGNTSGPTLGNIYMSDISYGPESNYIISPRN